MSSRASVIAGNWKMNGTAASIDRLLTDMARELSGLEQENREILVFPPHIYLQRVVQMLAPSMVGVGSQDVDAREDGAVTGAISASMVRDVGGKYSIIGHSERRALFGESDEVVADKFERCLEVGLVPIVCVGETLQERDAGSTVEVVTRQLGAVTGRVGEKFTGALVAYEPVWAIGTGKSATPVQAEEVHGALRDFLAGEDSGQAEQTRILYGGSVTPENAGALFKQDNIDGALVGGASLKATSFVEICKAAEKV